CFAAVPGRRQAGCCETAGETSISPTAPTCGPDSARAPWKLESTMPQSFTLIAGPRQDRRAAFARVVRAGLSATPKYLCCCYFYDRDGSLLFEEICKLPEYYLTRAEREVLEAHADDLAALLPAGVRVVELGSGYSVKTRLLLAAILRRQPRLLYVPVDICSVALQEAALALRSEIPNLEITALAAEYHDALGYLKNLPRQPQVVPFP